MINPPYGLVSNKAKYSYATGWTAEMVYCMAGADVPAFVESMYLAEYAASPSMAVVAVDDEPWMETDVVTSTGYTNSRKITLHFAIVYLDVPWPSNIVQPAYASGTTLKLKTRYAGQYQPIPPSAIQPSTGPTPGPNTQLSQYIALNEYTVEWDRVQDLDSLDFSGYVGAVNSDDFMGCASGTLFCAGAPQEPSFVLNPVNPCAWKTTVTLKQRAIVVADGDNAGTYGWNDWLNPKTQQWEPLTLTNGEPPYNAVEFSEMFS